MVRQVAPLVLYSPGHPNSVNMWHGDAFKDLKHAHSPADGIVIVPDFAKNYLEVDAEEVLDQLVADIPVYRDDEPLKRGKLSWVPGTHPALEYRGHVLRRSKLWFADPVLHEKYFVKYSYSGWKWRVSLATLPTTAHDTIDDLYCKVVEAGVPCNHVIITRYDSGKEGIPLHSDKTVDVSGDGILVVKLGLTSRNFLITELDKETVIFNQLLPPGTAVWMSMAANARYLHSVPENPGADLSGSIVFRYCYTFEAYPWAKVDKACAEAARKSQTNFPEGHKSRWEYSEDNYADKEYLELRKEMIRLKDFITK